VSTDEGAGALGATQARVATVSSAPWVAPGRSSAANGLATGVCSGPLGVVVSRGGQKEGVVLCVEKSKVRCLEIKNAYSFGVPAGVSCPGSACTPGLEPFHGSWTRVKRPGFSSPPGHPVTLRGARRGPVGTSSQGGPLNTLPQTGAGGLLSDVRRHPTSCLRPASLGIRGSPLFMGRLCP